MSMMDYLKDLTADIKSAEKEAKKSKTPMALMSREMQRNSIKVEVNHTQNLEVLHVEEFDEKNGMGECISLLLRSTENQATFNVRWYKMTTGYNGAPVKINEVTKDRLLECYEQYGVYPDKITDLKGKTIRAKVELVTGFGKDHYVISKLAQPIDTTSRGEISA